MQYLKTCLVSALFISIISFPILNEHFGFIKDAPSLENKKLAARPRLDVEHLDPYPASYEKFYNDTFDLRQRIVSAFNIYNCVLLKKSPVDQVIIGNHGWLYLFGNDMSREIGHGLYTREQLKILKEDFDRRQAYLAARNCKFYVMIAPSKANVHPEHVPFQYNILVKKSGEQLVNYLEKNSNIKTINLYNTFKNTHSKYPFYYKLDHHWNQVGAFYAANAVVKVMKKDFPALDTLSLRDFNVAQAPRHIGNMKQMLGNLDIFDDTEYELQPKAGFKAADAPGQNYTVSPPDFPYPWEYEKVKAVKGSRQPKLLIFTDSFGSALFPFIAEHFSKSVKIFGAWNYEINKDIVEKEKPDLVLLIIHEPNARSIFDHLTK